MTEDVLHVTRYDDVVTATLHRPERRNALSRDLRLRLRDLWAGLAGDDALRCVVVTGAGSFFSSGADAGEIGELGEDDAARGIAFTPGEVVACPVVLALNGPCIGGALRFVADADVVVAGESAWLSDPHVSFGVTSGPIAVDLAAKGHPVAVAPLVLGGARHRMPAASARAAGLVSEVVPDDRVAARAAELAADIAAQPPSAVRTTARLLREVRARGLADLRAAAWAATDHDLKAARSTRTASGEE